MPLLIETIMKESNNSYSNHDERRFTFGYFHLNLRVSASDVDLQTNVNLKKEKRKGINRAEIINLRLWKKFR